MMGDYLSNLIHRERRSTPANLNPITPPAFLKVEESSFQETTFSSNERQATPASTVGLVAEPPDVDKGKDIAEVPSVKLVDRRNLDSKPTGKKQDEATEKMKKWPEQFQEQTSIVPVITEDSSSQEVISVQEKKPLEGEIVKHSNPVPVIKEPVKSHSLFPANSKSEISASNTGAPIKPRHEPIVPLQVRAQKAKEIKQAARSPSEPTIRVSIGRIEVRAVSEPLPPPKKRASVQPKLTLDDYLRKRNGEKS